MLQDSRVMVELTATLRTGFHKYLFPAGENSSILLDLQHRDLVTGAALNVLDSMHVSGFRKSSSWARDQRVYFYLEFSQPFWDYDIRHDPQFDRKQEGYHEYQGKDLRAAFHFTTNGRDPVYVRVGISPVSIENAKMNLDAESNGRDFGTLRTAAKNIWNSALKKIEIGGGTDQQKTIFYTALYHCMVVPNTFSDTNGSFRGLDGQIHTDSTYTRYTVFSLWDTFRAWHPLMSLLDTLRTGDFIKTFIDQFREGGLLPVWELAGNETECMIGYHSVPVILDAYMSGIRGFDAGLALIAMEKSAGSRDRFGLGAYIDKGFLSVDDEPESVSKTLEYAYDDWCIARMASLLGKEEDAARFYLRCQGWKNIFDRQSGFMRPRVNGGWLTPFDPYRVDNNFTEANAWQYSFFVPQDIPGLIHAFGGNASFESRLDSLFSTTSMTSGRSQSDITGLIGQYAHGNEPSHHMAYLYDYCGKPWKTQERVSQITREMYKAGPDGLSGNEDCGQMSAWFIWSAMGLYPVTPGSGWYAIGSPLFPEIILHLGNGKTFTIHGLNVSSSNSFIQSATLNFQTFDSTFVNVNTLLKGGVLEFLMGSEPSITRGVQTPPATIPPGVPAIVPAPVISAPEQVFSTAMKCSISSEAGANIHYTVDGSVPDAGSRVYSVPFSLDTTTVVTAKSFLNGQESASVTAHYYKAPHPDWEVQLHSRYNPQYSAGGDEGIIDGLRGDKDWRKGRWQGFQAQDLEVVIDMKHSQSIRDFGAGFLQDMRSWIVMPVWVKFMYSGDGNSFSDAGTVMNTVDIRYPEILLKDFTLRLSRPVKARYIKVIAKNYGQLPSWHQGAGGEAFIFTDEVWVK